MSPPGEPDSFYKEMEPILRDIEDQLGEDVTRLRKMSVGLARLRPYTENLRISFNRRMEKAKEETGVDPREMVPWGKELTEQIEAAYHFTTRLSDLTIQVSDLANNLESAGQDFFGQWRQAVLSLDKALSGIGREKP